MVAILPRSLAWSSAPSAFCFKPAPPPSNGRHVLVCSTSSGKCGKFPMPVQRLDLALRIFLLCMPRICGQERTALHLCAMKSQPNDSCPSLLETAVMLINNGADVNAPDAGGCTPLHLTSNLKMAQLLVESNAYVLAENEVRAACLSTCYGCYLCHPFPWS